MVWTRMEADVDQATIRATLNAIDESGIMYHFHGTA